MDPLSLALQSLEGLSVGDAFGQCFFQLPDGEAMEQCLPLGPWYYTDDTEMSLSIVSTLARFGRVEQTYLAQSIAHHYDYNRAYGPSMHRVLERIRNGEHWAEVAANSVRGQGSWGNGAAMRVAPLGAFFAADPALAIEQAQLSAEVTHTHPEGIVGAVAIALASVAAVRAKAAHKRPAPSEFLGGIIDQLPVSEVRSRLVRAQGIAHASSLQFAVAVLGNGTDMSAVDTVPFAIWCCGQYLDDYVNALWLAVNAGGDRDTLCAMVGGVVAGYVGTEGIPQEWIARREALPTWHMAT